MDFELNADQQAILEAVEALLDRNAGPERAAELAGKAAYDRELDALLEESGFADLAVADETGPLEAALLVEKVAEHAGMVAIGARALVLPALGVDAAAGPIAIVDAAARGPIRFGAHARTLLAACGDEARLIPLTEGDSLPVTSGYGFPMGARLVGLESAGRSLGIGSAATLRAWWRVALAVEIAGTMSAALRQTCAYLSQRKQFGKPIGSFQGVQHRLAECAIQVQATRWLALEAAHHGAQPEAAAAAAAYASHAAGRIFADTHQLSGAIGFTLEHHLHVWSMRLQALRLELGGVGAHRRALAAARWGTKV